MNFHEDELHLSQHLLIIAIPADPLARRRHLRHVEQPLVDLNSHFVVLMNTNRSVHGRHFSPTRRSSARSPNAFNSHAVVNTSHHFTFVLKMKYPFFSESNQFPYSVSAHKVGKPSGNYSNLVLR